jgi:hypothetical protein
LYHDEAFAYSLWFGKWLSSQGSLANGRYFLHSEEFEAVLPRAIRLWDRSLDQEDLRFAVCYDPEETIAGQEHRMWVGAEGVEDLPAVAYGEWERSPKIGFSTVVLPALAIDRRTPSHTAYFDLENTALNLGAVAK